MALVNPLSTPTAPLKRLTTTCTPANKCPSFLITAANRSYKHQYSNIYFVRLRILREFVERRGSKRWKEIAGNPVLVPRVLEVVKSQLCYIVGTVYMDMPLKPNVLEDIARDKSIPPPPPLERFCSDADSVMLEDESGRIRLVGAPLENARLVTGVIIGALGVETANGDFEVIDICYAGDVTRASPHGMKLSEESMDVDDAFRSSSSPSLTPSPSDEWIALISGLDVGSESTSDARIQLLVEYLTGEGGGPEEQLMAAQISRLIIAGNSLAPILVSSEMDKKSRRYGYDSASFSTHPTIALSAHLLDLAQAMPIHILPGDADPSGTILPQQPFPRAMFGAVSGYGSFVCETNPAYISIASDSEGKEARSVIQRTFLVNSGQPLNDMDKYLPSPPTTRLSLAESTLRWRHIAPTAPDTLWCHPYFAADPFIMLETPDIYVIGNQPNFQTRLLVDEGVEIGSGWAGEKKASKQCRIVLVPRFADTGTLVLVNLRTLGVKLVQFAVEGMSGA